MTNLIHERPFFDVRNTSDRRIKPPFLGGLGGLGGTSFQQPILGEFGFLTGMGTSSWWDVKPPTYNFGTIKSNPAIVPMSTATPTAMPTTPATPAISTATPTASSPIRITVGGMGIRKPGKYTKEELISLQKIIKK
jgi:hypothetical protein